MSQLKPINQQVVCVVGASSGIGRETALRFAAQGAKVVVAARGSRGLATLVDEISRNGGEAHAVTCDVKHFDQVKHLADETVEYYGHLDTWVHLAAVSIYATFEQTRPEEFKQIIDVNLVGQVYGALAALPHLRREGRGALIHISSVEARRALPFQSAYSASKHGMKGFLEALRVELKRDLPGVTVTEIMPSSINTPFFDKARTKFGVKPKGVPPLYQPSLVANAILHAAVTGVPEMIVGGSGAALAISEAISPRLTDKIVALLAFEGQKTREAKSETDSNNLFDTLDRTDGNEGAFSRETCNVSPYTWFQTHPEAKKLAAALAIGAIAIWALRSKLG